MIATRITFLHTKKGGPLLDHLLILYLNNPKLSLGMLNKAPRVRKGTIQAP